MVFDKDPFFSLEEERFSQSFTLQVSADRKTERETNLLVDSNICLKT
jgi:hypothetical protein